MCCVNRAHGPICWPPLKRCAAISLMPIRRRSLRIVGVPARFSRHPLRRCAAPRPWRARTKRLLHRSALCCRRGKSSPLRNRLSRFRRMRAVWRCWMRTACFWRVKRWMRSTRCLSRFAMHNDKSLLIGWSVATAWPTMLWGVLLWMSSLRAFC